MNARLTAGLAGLVGLLAAGLVAVAGPAQAETTPVCSTPVQFTACPDPDETQSPDPDGSQTPEPDESESPNPNAPGLPVTGAGTVALVFLGAVVVACGLTLILGFRRRKVTFRS